MAAISGKWQLTSSDNMDAYLDAIGCSSEARAQVLPKLDAVGSLVEEYIIDTKRNVIKRNGYRDGELTREGKEFPIGQDIETESLDQRKVKGRLDIVSDTCMTRTESGAGFTARHDIERNGDTLTVVMTSGSVTAKRTYQKV